MKYVIVYWTGFGNNKKIVDYLAGKLQGEVQIFKTDEAPIPLPDADYYIFSSPTERFGLAKGMKDFMKGLENMDGKKYGLVNTHAMKKSWLKAMDKPMRKKNVVKVAEIEFRVSGEVNSGKGQPEGWEAKLDNFCSKLQ